MSSAVVYTSFYCFFTFINQTHGPSFFFASSFLRYPTALGLSVFRTTICLLRHSGDWLAKTFPHTFRAHHPATSFILNCNQHYQFLDPQCTGNVPRLRLNVNMNPLSTAVYSQSRSILPILAPIRVCKHTTNPIHDHHHGTSRDSAPTKVLLLYLGHYRLHYPRQIFLFSSAYAHRFASRVPGLFF